MQLPTAPNRLCHQGPPKVAVPILQCLRIIPTRAEVGMVGVGDASHQNHKQCVMRNCKCTWFLKAINNTVPTADKSQPTFGMGHENKASSVLVILRPGKEIAAQVGKQLAAKTISSTEILLGKQNSSGHPTLQEGFHTHHKISFFSCNYLLCPLKSRCSQT